MRLAFVTLVLLAATLILLPVHLMALTLSHLRFIRWSFALQIAQIVPMIWHRIACWTIGLKIRKIGTLCDHRPIMIAANHASWLDIVILGAAAPVSFIAKSDVASWPIFGQLAYLQRTIFVDRTRRQNTGDKVTEIAARMKSGDIIVLFPEGTTSDGNYILSFKSALFGAVQKAQDDFEAHAIIVQPVAIVYQSAHGLPLGRANRDLLSWPGDTELLPHLKNVILEGSIGVDVIFTEPIVFHESMARSAIAKQCEEAVRAAHRSALRHN